MTARRVIGAVVAGKARAFGQPDLSHVMALDPSISHELERVRQQAYAEGHSEGIRQGKQDASQRVESVAQAITLGCGEVQNDLERSRQAHVSGVVQLAEAIAEAVIGRTPHDEGAAVLGRVKAALNQLDEQRLQVSVHPDDVEFVQSGLGDHPGVDVISNANIGLGEAKITGGWSHADLTKEAAWEVIRRNLDQSD